MSVCTLAQSFFAAFDFVVVIFVVVVVVVVAVVVVVVIVVASLRPKAFQASAECETSVTSMGTTELHWSRALRQEVSTLRFDINIMPYYVGFGRKEAKLS